jgi:hypothetical protein
VKATLVPSIAAGASLTLVAGLGLAVAPSASGNDNAPLATASGSYQYGNWAQAGSGVDDFQVYTIVRDDTVGLIATGTFRTSGNSSANRIVQLQSGSAGGLTIDDTGFDSTVASQGVDPVKPGVYGSVLAADDSLYVGGFFAKAGDTNALNVARWDGTDWRPMGFGIKTPTGASSSVIENIVLGDDTVYAVGSGMEICADSNCTTSTAVGGIAQWSDDTWYPMRGAGTTTNDKIFTGAYIDDTLYVGGRFTQIEGATVTRLAAWNESTATWQSVGGFSPGGQIASMAVHPVTKDLYVAGFFNQTVAETTLVGVARYNVSSNTWSSVGNFGGSNSVDIATLAFSPNGEHLFIGGRFTNANVGGSNVTLNRIARLEGGNFAAAGNVGGSWQYLLSSGVVGLPASVRSLIVNDDGSVIAAGDFTSAGATGAKRVAIFTPGPEPSPFDPVFPAGAPTNVVATPEWNRVRVNWTPPASSGSYPISNYLVQASPGGAVCITRLTDADMTECTYTRLTPGRQYTFTVQALNGAGWGDRSEASNSTTPQNLRITESKRTKNTVLFVNRGSTITTRGEAPGFSEGTRIRPWIKIGDRDWEEQTSSTLRVNARSAFSWQRKFNKSQNSQAISVRFSIDGNFSNTVRLGPIR